MGHPTGGEHDAGSVREVPAPSAVVGLEAVVASEATGTTLWLSALRDPLLVLGVIKLFPSGTSFKDTHPCLDLGMTRSSWILPGFVFLFLGDVYLVAAGVWSQRCCQAGSASSQATVPILPAVAQRPQMSCCCLPEPRVQDVAGRDTMEGWGSGDSPVLWEGGG